MKFKKDNKLPNTKNVRKKNGTNASATVTSNNFVNHSANNSKVRSKQNNQTQSQNNISTSPEQTYLLPL